MKTSHAKYITDKEGNKTAVIISLKEYEKLLEDLHDLAVVAERREEKSISLQEMERQLKKRGILRL